ncbi:MAG: DUF5670 family protein [Gemmatimonadota bacterium]
MFKIVVVALLAVWLLGFIQGVGGPMVHLLALLAFLIVLVRFARGRRRA